MSACFFELNPVRESASSSSDSGAGGANPMVGSSTASSSSSSSSSAGGVGGTPRATWWNDDFARRARVNLPGVTEAVSDARIPVVFPVDFPYADADAAGADLRFVDADGTTVLAHEVERFDPTAGTLVWVRVPEVASASDFIWLYFGNPNAVDDAAPDQVWNGYVGVYHMAEDPAVAASVTDSTSPSNSGAPEGFGTGARKAGRLADAIDFTEGTSVPSILVSDDDDFSVSAADDLTVELWFKWNAAGDGGALFTKEACCLGYTAILLGDGRIRQSWGSGNCCQAQDKYDWAQELLPSGASDDAWHHVVFIYDRTENAEARHYLDGTLWKSNSIDPSPPNGFGDLRLGANFNGTASFPGLIDEIRFAKRIYRAPEILLNNLTANGTGLAFEDVEAR